MDPNTDDPLVPKIAHMYEMTEASMRQLQGAEPKSRPWVKFCIFKCEGSLSLSLSLSIYLSIYIYILISISFFEKK